MIAYYLSPLNELSRAGKVYRREALLVRLLVPGEQPGVHRCRVISRMPKGTGWVLCEVYANDFAALDSDGRCERLAMQSELGDPVAASVDAKLLRFGLDPALRVGQNTYGALIQRVGRLLNPDMVLGR